MRKTLIIWIASAIFLCCFGLYCAVPKQVIVPPLTRFERTGTTLDGWGWTTAPWTGDDKPYQKIREDVYKQLVAAKDVQPILDHYKEEAKAKPKNPLTQFTWGYAALRAPALAGHENVMVDVSGLPDALAVAPFPRTYDYARLRFLTQAQIRANSQLEDLGWRLLKRDPTDPAVMYQQVQVLRQTQARHQNLAALRLANSLVEAYPSQPVYIQTIGNLYEDSFTNFGFKKSDGDKAISAYQHYLQVAPANDASRIGVEKAIKAIQKGIQKLDAITKK